MPPFLGEIKQRANIPGSFEGFPLEIVHEVWVWCHIMIP